MRVRPPFLVLLGVVVASALLWQGVAFGLAVVRERREARVAAVEEIVRSLQPATGFTHAPCMTESQVCMKGAALPEKSTGPVVAMLAPHATATESRCYKRFRIAPADCLVGAKVNGVIVAAWLSPGFLPERPIRFEGSDLSFMIVEGWYPSVEAFLDMQEGL